MIYTSPEKYGRTDNFEIVEKIPADYQIWNIGAENMGSNEYLPLCQVLNKFDVNLLTLKTVKVEKKDFKFLNKVSMFYSLDSLSACEKVLKRKNTEKNKRQIAEKAKMIFQKYM